PVGPGRAAVRGDGRGRRRDPGRPRRRAARRARGHGRRPPRAARGPRRAPRAGGAGVRARTAPGGGGARGGLTAQPRRPAADHRGVIAFASCIADQETFTTRALPGLKRTMEPDSPFAELSTTTSIHEAYNEALEHFAAAPDLEALVLMHEDVELFDPAFCTLVR